jgi:ketosteroid isomerase-like protein
MREALVRLEERLAGALSTGDLATLADCYTEEAMLLPANRPAITGRAAIAAFYREVLARFAPVLSTEVAEVEVEGDLAYLRGTFHERLVPRGAGKPLEVAGKFLVIARRDPGDGSWRFHRDMFNSDRPPAVGLGTLLAGLFARRR